MTSQFTATTTRTALVALVALLALPQLARAQAPLTDDADAQHGSNPNLILCPASSVYLRFQLSSTLPAGTSAAGVARATVKVFVGDVRTPSTVDVPGCTSPVARFTSRPPERGSFCDRRPARASS